MSPQFKDAKKSRDVKRHWYMLAQSVCFTRCRRFPTGNLPAFGSDKVSICCETSATLQNVVQRPYPSRTQSSESARYPNPSHRERHPQRPRQVLLNLQKGVLTRPDAGIDARENRCSKGLVEPATNVCLSQLSTVTDSRKTAKTVGAWNHD